MKITVEKDDHLKVDEIVIRCKEKNDLVRKIETYIKSLDDIKIPFYQKEQEYFLNLNEILFFETETNSISAHTVSNMYYVKYKLYELEKILPKNFVRVSKSTIVNINHIYSLNKNITSSSVIEFNKTYKKVFVSRFYFKDLKEKLKERS
jgi:DNA-binding LytR/AlgR family response regulator